MLLFNTKKLALISVFVALKTLVMEAFIGLILSFNGLEHLPIYIEFLDLQLYKCKMYACLCIRLIYKYIGKTQTPALLGALVSFIDIVVETMM